MHTLQNLKFVHRFRTSFALALITVGMISLMKESRNRCTKKSAPAGASVTALVLKPSCFWPVGCALREESLGLHTIPDVHRDR
jgi:hypothetical protein